MDGNSNKTISTCCCFCNRSIQSTEVNPCELIIITNWDKSIELQNNQNFWCHIDCFKTRLHSDLQQHLVVDLLS